MGEMSETFCFMNIFVMLILSIPGISMPFQTCTPQLLFLLNLNWLLWKKSVKSPSYVFTQYTYFPLMIMFRGGPSSFFLQIVFFHTIHIIQIHTKPPPFKFFPVQTNQHLTWSSQCCLKMLSDLTWHQHRELIVFDLTAPFPDLTIPSSTASNKSDKKKINKKVKI